MSAWTAPDTPYDQYRATPAPAEEDAGTRVAGGATKPLDASESIVPAAATLIGLSGYAQSGKDTLGTIAVNNYRFTRLAFAAALKAVALDCDPGLADVETCHLRERVESMGWERVKRCYPDARVFLQNLGVAVREHVDPDAWVNAALRHVTTGGRYIVTDVRFPNEAQAIKDRGGVMVRVHRPGVGAVNAHLSETALDGWDFDHHVYNDGSLDKLGIRTALLLETVL